MSVLATQWAWNQIAAHDLDPAAALVLTRLAWLQYQGNASVTATHEQLASAGNIHRASVIRAVKKLSAKRLVDVARRGNGRTVFTLLIATEDLLDEVPEAIAVLPNVALCDHETERAGYSIVAPCNGERRTMQPSASHNATVSVAPCNTNVAPCDTYKTLKDSKTQKTEYVEPTTDRLSFETEPPFPDKVRPIRPETVIVIPKPDRTGRRGRKDRLENVTLPAWLPAEAWIGFLEGRRAMKKPATAQAIVELLKSLEKIREDGRDPEEALRHSTAAGWMTIHSPRSLSPRSRSAGNRMAAWDAIGERVGGVR